MSTDRITRRALMKRFGISAAATASVAWLPSLTQGAVADNRARPQRIIWVFSPNGVIQDAFWPKSFGKEFEWPQILQPLEPFRDRTLILKGVDNRIRGDGDDHMRGMSCLLTAIELFPGNIQGGGNTPASWPKGHSIDQELKRFLQSSTQTETRFGSLEVGVLVPDRADVWTRWVYTGPNRPVTPVSHPKQLMKKLYGDPGEQKVIQSVLDVVQSDLKRVSRNVSRSDRHLLEAHLQSIRETERRMNSEFANVNYEPPPVDLGVELSESNMPAISDVQQDLLVSAFKTDQARVATLQYDKSVGNIRMTFIGVEEGHHELSHDPDDKVESQEKLIKINTWYCGQVANLARKLAATPEADGAGSLLDSTTIIWTNELGKGNSHTLNDIPFVMVGGGLGFRSGEAIQFEHMPHNRLWLTLASSLGHQLAGFGNPQLSNGGPIAELMA